MDWKWLFFSFDGRANRAKWWLTVLIFVILSVIIWLVILPIFGYTIWNVQADATANLLSIVITLIFAYPATAVMVKRLHDRNRPAWLAAVLWAPTVLTLLGQLTGITFTAQDVGGQTVMVPTMLGWIINLATLVIGIWALIELGCLRGTRGPNQYGPDPLGRA
jgi:uncharacterized membrane protein YhaH (DUF805 family)